MTMARAIATAKARDPSAFRCDGFEN